MAHTCCGNPPLDEYWFPRLRLYPEEEEMARLQDEDSELALQLHDLVLHNTIPRERSIRALLRVSGTCGGG